MRQQLLKVFSLFLLACFFYVRVPFVFFHHHHHEPVCELNDHSLSQKRENPGLAHFHENETKPCFACSAQLIKEYSLKSFSFSFFITSLQTRHTFFISSPSFVFAPSTLSRAPPVSA